MNKFKNEYYDLVRDYIGQDYRSVPIHDFLFSLVSRKEYVVKYSWAIPNDEAIHEIAKHAPIVEMGAGTGYWAYLLRQLKVDILAFDPYPPGLKDNPYCDPRQWTEVLHGDHNVLKDYPDRTLFLCWPPYHKPAGADILKNYRGDVFLYTGETAGGCNGDDEFWEIVDRDFEEVKVIEIPQWPGIHDYFITFKRK